MEQSGLVAVGSEGVALRIEFRRAQDRYAQWISAIESDGREMPLLASFEGTAADEWPPSPPLQSLSIEEIAPGRRAALLVGMAGRSHWSASIEPVAGETAFVFDLACRTSEACPLLGSSYRKVATGPWVVALSPELACTVQKSGEDVKVVALPGEQRIPSTIRWRYKVTLARA